MQLPAYPVRAAIPALQRALAEQRCAVLAAPPGSGKTTLVPLALLEESWLAGKRIVMLEPRRVAARASAARMASLLGEKVGETVGYQIRFERRISDATRIEVVTEGLLTRRLQSDAELPGVGLVIFDEFHERSLDADLALALTLDARANLIPELRVLVMSATLDTQRVARLLDDAPIVEASGRLFPVDVRYLGARADQKLDETVANAVLRALNESRGDVLAFLPGAREIRWTQRRIEERARDIAVRPLYGELSSVDQDLALTPDAQGRRKVILATNIAQTSLTVEGVTSVVDGGYVRAARFDLGAGANRLETLRVSRAAAEQRAGRAGRLGPGVAYRCWSQDQQGALGAHDTPEILAADLTRLALELAAWGASDPSALALLDPPSAANWSYARELLTAFAAIDGAGRITPHGRELSRLPTAPRYAHLLLAARARGAAESGAWLAAALDERDAEGGSDLIERVERLRRGAGDPAQRRRVEDSVRQFQSLLGEERGGSKNAAGFSAEPLPALISLAFPERIARRRDSLRESAAGPRAPREVAFLCADGGEARLPETDPLARADWLAIAHWDPGAQRRIRLAAAIDETAVRREHAARIGTQREVRWDAQQEIVIAEEQQRLGAIILSARRITDAGEAGRAAMIAGLRSLGLDALPWTESSRQWQARVMSLRAWQPEGAWPEVSDEHLLATLEDWLAPFLEGVTRRAHLAALNLAEMLHNLLDYAAQQQLARLAPTHLTVPSGQRHALHYDVAASAPVLEVKLQEMFGCADTPTVCEGRIRTVLHLLSPARRPVAVTQDLAGFWTRGYLDVRKDLRGRYPRHPWPDDPRESQATHRAKPRGT